VVSFLVKESRETTESQLEVETQTPEDKSGDSDLRPGLHRFMLVVENERGVQSEPAIVEVEVIEPISRLPAGISRASRYPTAIDRVAQPEGVAAALGKRRATKKSGKGKSKDETTPRKKPPAKKTAPKR
jgi:hypothetical protein